MQFLIFFLDVRQAFWIICQHNVGWKVWFGPVLKKLSFLKKITNEKNLQKYKKKLFLKALPPKTTKRITSFFIDSASKAKNKESSQEVNIAHPSTNAAVSDTSTPSLSILNSNNTNDDRELFKKHQKILIFNFFSRCFFTNNKRFFNIDLFHITWFMQKLTKYTYD